MENQENKNPIENQENIENVNNENINENENIDNNENINEEISEVKEEINNNQTKNIEEQISPYEYLVEVKKALLELDEENKKYNVIKGRVTTFEIKRDKLVNLKNETIEKTVNTRRKEIINTYEEFVTESEKRYKKAVYRKDKEKQKNLNELIESNTKEIKNNNIYLNNQIKKVMQDNKIPGIVNTDFYLKIFAPKKISDKICCALYLIIGCVIIPSVICFFNEKAFDVFQKIIIFSICILFFGLVFYFMDQLSKGKSSALDEIRVLRDNIKDNLKEIIKITKNTKETIDDTKYDYTNLDREIEKTKIDFDKMKEKQKSAMENFENVVKENIKQDIEKASKKDIEKEEKELNKALLELEKEEKVLKDIKLKIAEEYEVYFGKGNVNVNYIDKIIDVVNKNENISLTEAIHKVKGK